MQLIHVFNNDYRDMTMMKKKKLMIMLKHKCDRTTTTYNKYKYITYPSSTESHNLLLTHIDESK
jgi:hypothetical protein